MKLGILRFFGAAKFEFEVKITKFKMADPIWRPKISRNQVNLYLVISGSS